MVGKVMTKGMMSRLVAGLADVERPWNCPHGRPTLRHLCSLRGFGDGQSDGREDDGEEGIDWRGWLEGLDVGEEKEEDVQGEGAEDDGSEKEESAGEEGTDDEYSFEVEH